MWKYKLGTVVQHKENKLFGHIVGFAQTSYETGSEPILLVKWENGKEFPIHPGNINLEP